MGVQAPGLPPQAARCARPRACALRARATSSTCNLPPFAHARTVAEEEARAETVGEDELVALAGVLHALQLQAGQLAGVDDLAAVQRFPQRVGWFRQSHRGEAAGLGNLARMGHSEANRVAHIVVVDLALTRHLPRRAARAEVSALPRTDAPRGVARE
jgi:hypothetical protein